MASETVLRQGLIFGKLPGMKDWTMYNLQVTPTHLHILDEYGRKNIRSLQIDNSDIAGEDTKNKKEFRFYLLRPGDGKYTFRCDSPGDKSCWISQLQSIIHKDLDRTTLSPPPDNHCSGRGKGRSTVLDTPLPAAPSPRASIISTDSGFGASEGGEVKRGQRTGFRSAPVSGDGQFVRGAGETSNSGDGVCGRLPVQVIDERGGSEMSYDKCKWFWGTASRQEAERRILSEGKIGNFIVRINASGHYVMTYWRKDGIHHHKILHHGNIYRFEKSAVEAEGESLVDLLDTYMKANSTKSKPMEPFGGALFEMYNYAWTPPSFDMNLLEERLKEQKRLREEAAKASRRPHQYTPVDIGESSSSSSREDSGSGSFTELSTKTRTKTLPPTPKRKSEAKSTVSMAPKTKPLPLTPTNNNKGSALVQELQNKKIKPPPTEKPAPKTKPTPKTKPKPASKSSQPPAPSYEPPEYANCNFGPSRDTPTHHTDVTPTQPSEDLYMNVTPPQAPPTRKARPIVQQHPPLSEYQNIGGRAKPRAYK